MYVTVNVAIATREIPRVLDLVRRAWLLGADAFIIQDWGLFCEIRRAWPQIETHVSTQANIHDARGTAWCRQMVADRVTLSRELSLKEISRIAEEGVERRPSHGAWVLHTGCSWLMSSLATGRSANRGLCAQPCRLPHDLVDEEGNAVEAPGNTRPLCPKDYCTVDHLQEMIDAGVGSLKVEGRMKAPDYVYNVVGAYREAIDATLAGRQLGAAEDLAVHRRLKRAFNRDFTDAYLMGTSGDEMMSYDRSNNRGEVVGTVASSRALEDRVARRGGGNGGRQRTRRYTQAEAVISLTEPVEKGDLLELRPVDDPSQFLTVHAEADAPAGATITAWRPARCPLPSIVSVIRSQNATMRRPVPRRQTSRAAVR